MEEKHPPMTAIRLSSMFAPLSNRSVEMSSTIPGLSLPDDRRMKYFVIYVLLDLTIDYDSMDDGLTA